MNHHRAANPGMKAQGMEERALYLACLRDALNRKAEARAELGEGKA